MKKAFLYLILLVIILPSILFSMTKDEKYEIAAGLYNDGLYSLATNELQKYLDDFPQAKNDDSVYFMLGSSFYNINKITKARSVFTSLIKNYPTSKWLAASYKFIANSFYKEKKYDLAAQNYLIIMQKFPASSVIYSAYFWYASSLIRQNLLEQAIKTLKQIVIQFPDGGQNDYVYYTLAGVYYKKGDYYNAALYYETTYKKYPNSPIADNAIFWCGESLFWVKNYKGAIEKYQKVLSISTAVSLYPSAQYRMAYAFYLMGAYNRAQHALAVFIKTYKNSKFYDQAVLLMADVSLRLKNDRDALAYLLLIPETSSKYGIAFLKRIQILTETTKYDKIIELSRIFSQIHQKSDVFDKVLYYYADANYYIKRYPAALKLYERYITSGDTEFKAEVFYKTGMIFTLRNENDSAIRNFQLSYAQNDTLTKRFALYKIGSIFLNDKDFGSAIDVFKKYIANYSKDTVYYNSLYKAGLAFYDTNKFQKAIRYFQELYISNKDYPEIAEVLVKLGDAYYRIGKYQKAVHFYSIIKHQYKDSRWYEMAIYGLSWAYMRLNDYREAGDHFTLLFDATKDTPTKKQALYLGAINYENGKYYDLAISNFKRYVNTFSDSNTQNAYFHIGLNYFRKGEPKHTITSFRAFVKKYPKSKYAVSASFYTAQAYSGLSDYTQAIDVLKKAVALSDSVTVKTVCFMNIGDNYYNQGKIKDAIVYYTKALNLSQNKLFAPQILSSIGWAYFKNNQDDSGILYFRKLIAKYALYREVPDLLYKLATYYYNRADYSTALQYFLKLKLYKKYKTDAVLYIADCYVKLGNSGQGISMLNKILKTTRDTQILNEVLFKKGTVLLETKKYGSSADIFNELLNRKTGITGDMRMNAQFNLAKAYGKLGKDSAAAKLYNELAQKNRDTLIEVKALIELGNLKFRSADYLGAATVFSEIVARNNRSELGAYAQFYLAKSYEKMENYARSIKEYYNVVYIFPAYKKYVLQSLLSMATISEKTGHKTNARQIYEKMIEKYPDSKYTIIAKKRLAKYIKSVRTQ